MIYLDANVFLYAIINEPRNELADASSAVLGKVVKGEIPAATSLLTWDEVFWILRKNLGHNLAVKEGRKFLGFPNLAFVRVDGAVIDIAQDFAEKYRLKPRDAIHAATAVSRGIRQIVSDDPDFDAVKEIKRVPIDKFR